MRLVGCSQSARVITALAQRCPSWCRQPRVCHWTPGINPRGIMCLLDDVLRFKSRTRWRANGLFWALLLVVGARQTLSHLTMGIAIAKCLLWWLFFCDGGEWRIYRNSTTPFHWFAWSNTNHRANNVVEIPPSRWRHQVCVKIWWRQQDHGKTIVLIDLIALTCQTHSLGYVLIDKTALPSCTHYTEAFPAPPEAIRMQVFNQGWPCTDSAGSGHNHHGSFGWELFEA